MNKVKDENLIKVCKGRGKRYPIRDGSVDLCKKCEDELSEGYEREDWSNTG